MLINFYQELFLSSNPSLANGVLDRIPHLITVDMNQELSKEFLACEVQIALSQMAPLKASGPDGMPPLFYQHFWGMVDDDVIRSILSWLNSGTLPHPVNHTFITLILRLIILSMCINIAPLVYVMFSIKFFQK